MEYLLDTNIAIYLREGVGGIVGRIGAMSSKPYLSVVSQVELEGGVYTHSDEQDERRAAVDGILRLLPVLDFTFDMAQAYGQIVARSGFSRRKIIDRMIAATAIVADLTLITVNGADFADIPDLRLEIWDL